MEVEMDPGSPTRIWEANVSKWWTHDKDLLSKLKNSTRDLTYETILPNVVQLVESELPLLEADNCDQFAGEYLFRQIYSPKDKFLQCLFCCGQLKFRLPRHLKDHYFENHDITVHCAQEVKFNKFNVFVCVPSDVNDGTQVNSACQDCDTTLKTLSQVRDHYPNLHNKTVRLLPESEVKEIGKKFHCGLCPYSGDNFSNHLQHMNLMHRMKIMLPHAVQTGPKTWSCAKCLYPHGVPNDMLTHIPDCQNLHAHSECNINGVPDYTVLYICKHCPQTFSSEDEIKEHMAKNNHIPGIHKEEHMAKNNHIPSIYKEVMHDADKCKSASFDCKTCLLCLNTPFTLCDKHHHQVHLQWLLKSAADYSKVDRAGPHASAYGKFLQHGGKACGAATTAYYPYSY